MCRFVYRFLTIIAVLRVCGILVQDGALLAQEKHDNLEYAVKAACIVNFLHFIEFPASSSGGQGRQLRIYILGTDNFGGLLDEALSKKNLNNLAVSVVRLSGVDGLRGLDLTSQVVFVAKSMHASIADILKTTSLGSCLTIGETPHFCEQGGIIGLRLDNNKIRFDINELEAKKTGITISSQVLKLARIVNTGANGSR